MKNCFSGSSRRLATLILWMGVLVCASLEGLAQNKPDVGTVYTWDGAPLEAALYEFSDAAGVAIVFAHRLVDRVHVSGTYKVGDDPEPALTTLLDGTRLRAERIRRGRYVIISEPLNAFLDPDDRSAILGDLRGRVIDAKDDQPLWGAHVWLIDLGLGAVVGEDGSFEVPDLPTGEYVVRFSHVGYKPVRSRLSVFPVSPQRPPTIRLQPEVLVSQEAQVLPGAEADPPPGMIDLDVRQAASLPIDLGEADLAQAVAWLPGVTRMSGGQGELVVRSASPSYTAYLRDGVPVYQPWHAYGMLSAFQPEAMKRARFHRGSLPPELGGGLAGVMEVETKDGLIRRPAGTA
ncbi:MAG: TonB-dependent receptor, partial [Rubricoccaceae bacterium]|nr:TonB-dependent receptor [Rubricoccaceae bacterium]